MPETGAEGQKMFGNQNTIDIVSIGIKTYQ